MARMMRYNSTTQQWEAAQWTIPGSRPLVVIDGIPIRFWSIVMHMRPRADLAITHPGGQAYGFEAPHGWLLQIDLQLCRAAGPAGGRVMLRVELVVEDREYAAAKAARPTRPLLLFKSKPGTATWQVIKE